MGSNEQQQQLPSVLSELRLTTSKQQTTCVELNSRRTKPLDFSRIAEEIIIVQASPGRGPLGTEATTLRQTHEKEAS